MEFYDVGAVVWILRKCVWLGFSDFPVAEYEDPPRDLDAQMRGGHPFVAHSTRRLIEARVPTDEDARPCRSPRESPGCSRTLRHARERGE